ncbi:MAG: hypothetical protein AVDCRST_MAG83-2219, partial [uncultured Arthrobacter sp.]
GRGGGGFRRHDDQTSCGGSGQIIKEGAGGIAQRGQDTGM